MPDPKITIGDFNALSTQKLPFAGLMGYRVEEQHLRPGGTVAGPALMGLADATVYAVVMGMIGPVELAVTTNLT